MENTNKIFEKLIDSITIEDLEIKGHAITEHFNIPREMLQTRVYSNDNDCKIASSFRCNEEWLIDYIVFTLYKNEERIKQWINLRYSKDFEAVALFDNTIGEKFNGHRFYNTQKCIVILQFEEYGNGIYVKTAYPY